MPECQLPQREGHRRTGGKNHQAATRQNIKQRGCRDLRGGAVRDGKGGAGEDGVQRVPEEEDRRQDAGAAEQGWEQGGEIKVKISAEQEFGDGGVDAEHFEVVELTLLIN